MDPNIWEEMAFGVLIGTVGLFMFNMCTAQLKNTKSMILGTIFTLGVVAGLLMFILGIVMMQRGLTAIGQAFTHWLVQLNGG